METTETAASILAARLFALIGLDRQESIDTLTTEFALTPEDAATIVDSTVRERQETDITETHEMLEEEYTR